MVIRSIFARSMLTCGRTFKFTTEAQLIKCSCKGQHFLLQEGHFPAMPCHMVVVPSLCGHFNQCFLSFFLLFKPFYWKQYLLHVFSLRSGSILVYGIVEILTFMIWSFECRGFSGENANGPANNAMNRYTVSKIHKSVLLLRFVRLCYSVGFWRLRLFRTQAYIPMSGKTKET